MIKDLYFISGLYCDFCHIFIWMIITLLHHKIPTGYCHDEVVHFHPCKEQMWNVHPLSEGLQHHRANERPGSYLVVGH